MNQLLQIVCTPVVLLPVLLDVRAIFAGLLTLKILGMPFIPLLLKVVLGDLAVAVHTVAARRSMENFATALCATVVAGARLVVEAHAAASLLGKRCGTRRLHVSRIAEHGHLDANFRNAMLVFLVVYRARSGPQRRAGAAALGRPVVWGELAKASSLGAGRVGASHCLDPALRGGRWHRGRGGVQRQVPGDVLGLLWGAIGLAEALVGERLGQVLEAGVLVALLADSRKRCTRRARGHVAGLGRRAVAVRAVQRRGRERVSVRIWRDRAVAALRPGRDFRRLQLGGRRSARLAAGGTRGYRGRSTHGVKMCKSEWRRCGVKL
jgi:hypothetical protein